MKDEELKKILQKEITKQIAVTFLNENFLTKKQILFKIKEKQDRSRGYLSNIFSALTHAKILISHKGRGTWSKGDNYNSYIGEILLSMNSDVIENFQYLVLPKQEENSLDFIFSPSKKLL